MADKTIDYNALAQVIDSTWGRSSTTNVVAGYSVIFSFGVGGTLLAKFNEIVNFTNEGEAIKTKRRMADNAGDVIKSQLSRVKTEYKTLTGDAISFKDVHTDDSLEMLSANPYNLKRTALFKRIVTLEIT